MSDLPYIDTNVASVAATPEQAWSALLATLRGQMGGAGAVARALGCDPARASPEFDGRPGQTLPGFRVAHADPGHRLELRGRHRFSRYSLTFALHDGTVAAETRAAFPGVLGRLYRAAVIDSGAHRVITRRLVRQVARHA
ncbi:hypothetical protein FSW04_18790 [Baekduia soli]|uniref:DUF2867 domain-containing protein n=1 Tax=Baekduia soli TaxID=496014 RepID=A0A5B8U8H2_9ACTN|nr:hypothetical protein [Baekduia soli]QEC49416.1 hypothetical protein FSW04_18790 [Baekduia soli]